MPCTWRWPQRADAAVADCRAGAFARALQLVVVAVAVAGCATTATVDPGDDEPRDTGLITNTVGERPTGGVSEAYIYEVDGEPVAYTRRSHRLPPGKHTVRVWPRPTAATSLVMIPDTVAIERDRIDVGELEIEVEGGYRYYVGARSNVYRVRTRTGPSDVYVEEQRFIDPVVTRVVEPVELAEAVTGLSVFFSLVFVPLLVVGL